MLEKIEINPKTSAIGSVIWLHGLGANGNDFVPIIQAFDLPSHLPLRFVFPHAPFIPVTINNGHVMRAWYDIHSLTTEHISDNAGIENSIKEVTKLIEHETTLGIPSERIILGGFSQGSVVALSLGLTYPKRLGGIIALSGYLSHRNEIQKKLTDTTRTTPIFLAHGEKDNVVPYFLGEITFQFLQKNNCQVDWHSYPIAHSVSIDEINDITHFLKKIFLSAKQIT